MKEKKKLGLGRIFMRTFAYDNIVLTQALGLCPIIAAGVSLKRGLALTVCTAAVMIPCSLLMATVGKRLSAVVRAPLYAVLATALMVGCAFLLTTYVSPELYASLYLFLPLVSVNTLFTYHAGGFSAGRTPLQALFDALGTSCGFGVVICVVSALREMAIAGKVFGIPLPYEARFPEAAYPFAAFILLGFMAAFMQHIRIRRLHNENGKEELLNE